SEPECPGDGNQDGVVDAEDVNNWRRLAQDWGLSSVYDFVVNGVRDGLTNADDESVILSKLNTRCEPSHGIY
ncbi:MAG: arylsulfatase, partial [Pigmentiphaga sp.]